MLSNVAGEYLPEYRHAQKITLRQMLTMRSAIPMDTQACESVSGRMDIGTLIENLNLERT
jgi:CubicO group peptidase (beta-lactamase class C family)